MNAERVECETVLNCFSQVTRCKLDSMCNNDLRFDICFHILQSQYHGLVKSWAGTCS